MITNLKTSLALFLLAVVQTGHAGVPLSDSVSIEFASKETAAMLLGQSDDYTARLSRFDLVSKPQKTAPVSNEAFRAHAAAQAMGWSNEEQVKFTAIFMNVRASLAPYIDLLPPQVNLVKTTGREEAGAFYTRGDSIFIPSHVMVAPPDFLEKIMLHELFHVLSRKNPDLRDELYASIGFIKTDELVLPQPLDDQKITNPDVPVYQHLIRVTVDGKPRWAAPIIYSDTEYDPAKERSFFPYIQLKLLIYDWDGESPAVAVLQDGKPVLRAFDEVRGFFEQIGRNTDYLYHAEEILAENFVLLAQGRSAPTPEVLERMRVAFSNSR